MARFLVSLAAREGQEGALQTRLLEEFRSLRSRVDEEKLSIEAMVRVPDDPFAAQYPVPRAFDAVIDFEASGEVVSFSGWLEGIADRLVDFVYADLSGVVTGEARRIAGSVGGPERFLYFMRRKADSTHESFGRYWGEEHAKFGKKMPGTLGYEQLHVDPAASRTAATHAGFGISEIDGVAILHLESVTAFGAAAGKSTVGAQAIEDERNFVDGRNSVGMALKIVHTSR